MTAKSSDALEETSGCGIRFGISNSFIYPTTSFVSSESQIKGGTSEIISIVALPL